jgi:hypothetical protein
MKLIQLLIAVPLWLFIFIYFALEFTNWRFLP